MISVLIAAVSVFEAGLKVVVDIVPNHTSDRHPWFTEALSSPPGSAAPGGCVFRRRDRSAGPGLEPPSRWRSQFGASAWVGDGQWYLHAFAKEQPDLKWSNPEVREDFLSTLRLWSGCVVDGFGIDVAHWLVRAVDGHLDAEVPVNTTLLAHGSHPLWDRDELKEVHREWRQVLDTYDPPRAALAEASVHPSRRWRYSDPSTLGQAFTFDLLGHRSMASCTGRARRRAAAGTAWSTWGPPMTADRRCPCLPEDCC